MEATTQKELVSSARQVDAVEETQLSVSHQLENGVAADTQQVVSKDFCATRPEVTMRALDNVLDVNDRLDDLRSMAATWYASSQQHLYTVLGHCYALWHTVEKARTAKARDTYRAEIAKAYEKLNGTQRATKHVNMIISIVFDFADIDRKLRSRYARAISIACEAENAPADASAFVDWIKERGGIIAAVNSAKPKATATFSVTEVNECVRGLPSIGTVALKNGGNRFVLLLADAVNSDSVRVIAEVGTEALCNQLARKLHKKLIEEGGASLRQTAADAADALRNEPQAEETA